LFAPPKRTDLLPDGANPVYEKEIRSEIFSQGTLMLRVVIQVSMMLAIPIMAVCLFIFSQHAAWYISYVVVFNILVGPVFSAGSVTSERERETLDLLLTTTITPWQILWGKLIAGLRVSSVLTLFLVWPFFLAVVMVSYFWGNWLSVIAFAGIILFTCLTTALIALFCSVVFQKTVTSLMTTYTIILAMFCAPIAVSLFTKTFILEQNPAAADRLVSIDYVAMISPFAAAFSVPLTTDPLTYGDSNFRPNSQRFFLDRWSMTAIYFAGAAALNLALFTAMIALFRARWRVAH
jgi:ABC-type transport system involved in multi-copper enzyme maturation permease subunit